MDLIKLFTDSDPRGVYVVNLILCVFGALWTAGMTRTQRDQAAWNGWIGFWLGTGLFYLIISANPNLAFWIPQSGLYLATASLLVSYFWSTWQVASPRLLVAVCSALVIGVAALDVRYARPDSEGSFHQTLTAVAIGLWAWRLRQRDESKSVTVLTYALIQLPIQPMLTSIGTGKGDGYAKFVAATYVLYAALKLPLLPAICLAVQRPKHVGDDRADGTRAPVAPNTPTLGSIGMPTQQATLGEQLRDRREPQVVASRGETESQLAAPLGTAAG